MDRPVEGDSTREGVGMVLETPDAALALGLPDQNPTARNNRRRGRMRVCLVDEKVWILALYHILLLLDK